MSELAIQGGSPVRTKEFPLNITIGEEEKAAALKVLEGGQLSGFYAAPDKRFFGGAAVIEFEQTVAQYFGAKYATSVNSATSALHAAVFAAGVHDGDEVICCPYTMSASATAVLMQNGIPVFADVDMETYTIDPADVEKKITNKTKAILAVNIFGGPAKLHELRKIADKHNIFLIEDCAQSPGAKLNGDYTGMIGHIGIMSLNCHKAVQTGEGGVAITNDSELDLRMKLIRNHGEVVAGIMEGTEKHTDVVGYNYRLSELQAAIGTEQWKKLDQFNEHRIRLCQMMNEAFSNLEGFQTPKLSDGIEHVYYVYPLRLIPEQLGVDRAKFCEAVRAEGIPLREGYVLPLYLEPIYQRWQTKHNCPQKYQKGLCPNVEQLHYSEMTTFHQVYNSVNESDIKDVIDGIIKVYNSRNKL